MASTVLVATKMGTALFQLTEVNSRMQTTYSTAQVCGLGDNDEATCVPLDPDMTNIMADSRDYNLLRETWQGWRNESGAKMRADFIQYVDLNNEVARLNSK